MARRKKSKSAQLLDPANLLKLLREAGKPMKRGEVLSALDLPKQHKGQVTQALDKLVDENKLLKLKGGAYGLMDNLHLVKGTLEVTRSGVGYVICDDKRRKDILIKPPNMGDAWHDDRVAVAVTSHPKAPKPEGRIARVLERGRPEIPVRVTRVLGKGMLLTVPTDTRKKGSLMLEQPRDLKEQPAEGEILLARIGEKLEQGLWSGTFLERLGDELDIAVQETLVKVNHAIPMDFPASVIEEAETLPEVPSEADFAGRRDLRDLEFVTIDGAKAKDFDDAILVVEEEHGYRLFVAIADVAHYVPLNSRLDKEARERGNSSYFPQSVEPMFPEALSNGLCSLNPDVDRLAMVAEMTFGKGGKVGKATFYPAVFRSHARLTYEQVRQALLTKDPETRAYLKPLLPMLTTAEALARILNEKRSQRGSLDFDLPEPELLFNIYGATVDIRPKVRHFGHQIIEEFMIAANEAVATFLTEKGAPLLYRAHPEPDPDKLDALFAMLKQTDLAHAVPAEATPTTLQGLLEAAEEAGKGYLVSRLVLRSMMQATYTPEHLGHFGLASECYGHFTSPIRRYADLVVHRSLKAVLAGEDPEATNVKNLRKLGEQLSTTERRSMEAEREILKRVTIIFLREKIGQTFSGVVSGVADFGFWVELTEVLAEGMVRLSSLDDDYYSLIPERQELMGQRTGRRFRLGQQVHVALSDVNLGRLEVNLRLLPDVGDTDGDGLSEDFSSGVPTPREVEQRTGKRKRPSRSRRSSSRTAREKQAPVRTEETTDKTPTQKSDEKPGQPAGGKAPQASAGDSGRDSRRDSGRDSGRDSRKASDEKPGQPAGGKAPQASAGDSGRDSRRDSGRDSRKASGEKTGNATVRATGKAAGKASGTASAPKAAPKDDIPNWGQIIDEPLDDAPKKSGRRKKSS